MISARSRRTPGIRVSLTAALFPLLCAMLAGCGGPSSGPDPAHPVHPVQSSLPGDAAAALAAVPDGFSGVVAVARPGSAPQIRGFGLADRRAGTANEAATRFCIASMGKMFTGVAVAQLVEQGRLSFNDLIGQHLDGFPPAVADHVTIGQLLTHTSGMADAGLGGPDEVRPPVTLDAMLDRIRRAPLTFTPGSRFSYSNDGFIVAGAIVQEVTGMPYAEYLKKYVFAPAGMTRTEYRAYRSAEVPGMARGYSTGPDGALKDESDRLQVANPSGGEISTAADMIGFFQALLDHRLLSPAMTNQVITGQVATDRPVPGTDRYGYGFADTTIEGIRRVGHNGGTPGYEDQLDAFPADGTVVVVLANQDGSVRSAVDAVEAVLTGKPLPTAGRQAGGTAAGGTAAGGTAAGGGPAAYTACMREHGVPDFPAPDQQGHITLGGAPGGTADPMSPSFQRAEAACSAFAPQGGPQRGSAP